LGNEMESRQYQPLDILHIENTTRREIMIMGIVSIKDIIMTPISVRELAVCVDEDPEIFPCLNSLRPEDS
jgi:hypothetical protein